MQFRFTLIALLVLFALFLSAFPQSPSVHTAGTITVNTLDDSTGTANCSLRDAITAANNNSTVGGCTGNVGTDTIDLTGLSGSIFLVSTLPAVNSPIVFDGPTGATVTIDGGDTFRIMVVKSGAAEIRNLTFAHGRALGGKGGSGVAAGGGGAAGMGGAILILGGTVTTDHVIFNQNAAFGGDGGGVGGSGGSNGGGGGGVGGAGGDGQGGSCSPCNGGVGGDGGPFGGTGGTAGTSTAIGGNGGAGAGGGGASDVDAFATGGAGGFGGGGAGGYCFGGAGGFGGGGGGGGGASGTCGTPGESGDGGIGAGDGGSSPPAGGGGGAAMGGAIFIFAGSLDVNESSFEANFVHAGRGGAGTNPGEDGSGFGGAIFRYGGSLIVSASSFTGNSSDFWGGALFNYDGSMSVSESLFNNNHADDTGGAIAANDDLSISYSTFVNNNASNGGALFSQDPLNVDNSTFFDNHANLGGGAILTAGTLNIYNSTLVGNLATVAGGINDAVGPANLFNTIVAHSTGGNCFKANVGTLTADSHNLATDNSCDNATQKTFAALKLGPLADHGGPTPTMALMSRSAALNFGDDSVCSAGPVSGVDQRGITRPQGAHCDTGAFEASLIMGQKFNDLNGNGVKDGSESGLPGWTIQLKNTSNAILDSTTTNSTGNYTLTVPTLPFTYRVREVLQAGWHQTTPNPADIPLSILTPGVTGIDFGNNLVANLTITKIARRVSNSSNIRFTINVINSGPADATKVIVTDPLANKLQFVSATTDKGSCTFASPTVTCSLGKLKSGNGAKITIVVTPKTSGLQPHNCATATTTSVQDDPNKQACVDAITP